MRFLVLLFSVLFFFSASLNGQTDDGKRFPAPVEGSLTPYFWGPWVNGTITIDRELMEFQPDVNATPIDLLKNLDVAVMLRGNISKGHFVAGVDYIYMALRSQDVVFEREETGYVLVSDLSLKGNIFEFTAGGRWENGIVTLDPYIGVRYANFKMQADLTDGLNGRDAETISHIVDGLIGIDMTLLPHPRVPITIRGDVGGFKGGSDLAWKTRATVGYGAAKLIDVYLGLNAWGFDHKKEAPDRTTEAVFAGVEVGIKFYFPKREFETRKDRKQEKEPIN